MRVEVNLPKAKKLIEDKVKRANILVGAQGVTYVSEQIRTNRSIVTSNLINSITYATISEAPTPKKGVKGLKGKALKKPDSLWSVKIGTTVVYAPRVEFGFIGKDSLGRLYNQKPKSFLRAALVKNTDVLVKLYRRALQ